MNERKSLTSRLKRANRGANRGQTTVYRANRDRLIGDTANRAANRGQTTVYL
jgi:hypothetical protein